MCRRSEVKGANTFIESKQPLRNCCLPALTCFFVFRNCVNVVIPSGPTARAARKRIWRSGWSDDASVRTNAPWSHPVEVNKPLFVSNHWRTGRGLVWPNIRSLEVTLTPFFGVLNETTAAG